MKTHSELITIASAWLRRKCSIVITEIATSGEEPDAIGWHGTHSTLVECKISREDFRRDKHKWFRLHEPSGIGQKRFFICEPGVISVEELPPKWGLLEVGAKIRKLRESETFEANHRQEIKILLSSIRRIGQTAPKGMSIKCYTIETGNRATIAIK